MIWTLPGSWSVVASPVAMGRAACGKCFMKNRFPKTLWDQVLEDLPEPDEAIAAFLDRRLSPEPDRKELQKDHRCPFTPGLCLAGHSPVPGPAGNLWTENRRNEYGKDWRHLPWLCQKPGEL